MTEIQAQSLHNTFMADGGPPSTPLPTSSSFDDDVGSLPVFPPEAPGQVVAELAAVAHMLHTAAHWLQSVDVSSVPPDRQGELVHLTAACFRGGLRLSGAQETLEGLDMEAMHHHHLSHVGGDYLEWEDLDDSPPCPETPPVSFRCCCSRWPRCN